jgi:hypothetical protein
MTLITNLTRSLQTAGAIVAAFLATAAQAQFGEAAGIAEAMQQDYLRRDIVLFEQGLNLDDAQRTIVDALYQDYEQAFNDGLAGMRKNIEDMREELQSQDVDRVLRRVFQPIEEWSVEKRALGDQFLENVKVVLTTEQQEQWPRFERFLFREKYLPRGQISGESLNLFHVVRDLRLNDPQTQHMQPTLDEYDVTLDQALRNRQKAFTSSQSDMLKSFSEQNPQVSLAILQRQIEVRVAVRNVNDQYIVRLAEVMPDDRRAEFKQKALERAYPRIYRPTPVQNIFAAARDLEGLDGSTRSAVAELEASYLSELAAVNTEWFNALRRWEPDEQRKRAEAFAQRMSGQQPAQIEDPTRELSVRRDEVARNYAKQLQGIMSADQFAQLPGAMRWAETPADPKGTPEAMPTGEPAPKQMSPGVKGEGDGDER